MRTITFGLLLLFSAAAFGQVVPMKSFGFRSPSINCHRSASEVALDPDGNITDLMPLDGARNVFAPPAVPGSRPQFILTFPPGNFKIRKVCLTHWVNGSQANAYAVVGHWGPNGDHISPMFGGSDTRCMDFPVDAPVVFTAGEYLDVHAGCEGDWHWITLHIWYTP